MDFKQKQPFTAIIKLGRARTFFFNTTLLKDECHLHLGWFEGE